MLQVPEPRFAADLTVLVVGRDAIGNPFKQTAKVTNISRHGGRLSGIRCVKGPGDVVQVEHRGKKAAFRVVWVDLLSGNVGLYCIEAEAKIWGVKLQNAPSWVQAAGSSRPVRQGVESSWARPADAEPRWAGQSVRAASGFSSAFSREPAADQRQRTHPRYRCAGGVTANAPAGRVWGRLSVISLGGCYIETISPFRVETNLDLLIGAHGIELRVTGQVRCSHPGMGMGIMFMQMNEANRKQLEKVIAAAAGPRH